MSNSLKDKYASTPLFGANANAVEALYERFLGDPAAVPEEWRDYFETLGADDTEVVHSVIRDKLLDGANSRRKVRSTAATASTATATSGEKQAAVSRLIQVYSLRGHQIADIDPLGLMDRPVPGVLKLDYLGLTDADMETEFYTGGLAGVENARMQLRDILNLLRSNYCGKIGA